PIAEGECDFVLGSRLAGDCEPGALLPQARYGNMLAVLLIRLLFGFRYTDLGPFRAIGFPALRTLGMRDETFGWTVEMQVKALRRNLRVREVPVPYRKRVGRSKITGTLTGTMRAGVRILWTIFKYRLGPTRSMAIDREPS
ncbi:MAG: glycosyltransferase family 2 protein, partial [Acidobacteriota bacterium]